MAWKGWAVICIAIRGIVKLNCRLCPSCIWAPAYPSGVHQALSRRLEQFMAANAAASAAPAVPAGAGRTSLDWESSSVGTGRSCWDGFWERGKNRILFIVPGDDKEDKEEGDAGRDDDRSRSPRLRRHEPFDPSEADRPVELHYGLGCGNHFDGRCAEGFDGQDLRPLSRVRILFSRTFAEA